MLYRTQVKQFKPETNEWLVIAEMTTDDPSIAGKAHKAFQREFIDTEDAYDRIFTLSLAAADGEGVVLPSGASGAATKTCPDCAETVLAAARICRFCRHEFEPEAPPVAEPPLAPSVVAEAAPPATEPSSTLQQSPVPEPQPPLSVRLR